MAIVELEIPDPIYRKYKDRAKGTDPRTQIYATLSRFVDFDATDKALILTTPMMRDIGMVVGRDVSKATEVPQIIKRLSTITISDQRYQIPPDVLERMKDQAQYLSLDLKAYVGQQIEETLRQIVGVH